MPTVDGKTFDYTPEGRQQAQRARRRSASQDTRRPAFEQTTDPRRRSPAQTAAPPPGPTEPTAGGLPPAILKLIQSSVSPPRPTRRMR